MYLLTDTTGEYFPRLGFHPVAPAIQASVEFTSACPQSALVMEREIRDRRLEIRPGGAHGKG